MSRSKATSYATDDDGDTLATASGEST